MRHIVFSVIMAIVIATTTFHTALAVDPDCGRAIEGITVLNASGEAIVVDIPGRGQVTVTRKKIDDAARVLQFIYKIDPKLGDGIVDRLAEKTKLGIFGETALAAMTKSALGGDPQATDTMITLIMQQSPATLRHLLDRAIALGRSNPMLCMAITSLSPRS